MNWFPNPNSPNSPPVLCTSQAADYHPVLCALWLALHHMFSRRETDGVKHTTGLHLHADATNGTIDLAWCTAERAIDGWVYTLRLPKLWADSLEHPEGAGHFEQVIDLAVHLLVEDHEALCDGEIVTGCREGLRPMNWGQGASTPKYDHPAYDVKMPKSPLDFYLSSDANPTPQPVYV